MLARTFALALLAAAPLFAAAPPKTIAPDFITHPNALFLKQLSADGKQRVIFRATAMGTRFFLEEPAGVTVYSYDGSGGYKRETFLKNTTLAKAVKKYEK